jgi:hypothetical protein
VNNPGKKGGDMTREVKVMKPEQSIRRFDVFAEYRKQEQEVEGVSEDEAKGYGLWVAKVVASRRFGGTKGDGGSKESKDRGQDKGPELVDGKWHTLDGEPQTDTLFDREIVRRMGPAFYREVFAPAIREARDQGKRYESIRDTIRKDWKAS